MAFQFLVHRIGEVIDFDRVRYAVLLGVRVSSGAFIGLYRAYRVVRIGYGVRVFGWEFIRLYRG